MSSLKRAYHGPATDAAAKPPAADLMAVLAHELRNPLGALLVSLESIRYGRSDDVVTRARDGAERQARKMARIIDDLFDLARSTLGKPVLHRSRVELAEVVAGAVETVGPVLDAAGLRLTVSLPPAPVILCADGPRLERVLVNLLSNAARYGCPGGEVHLTAAAAAGLVFVRVKDNGAGIAPDLLPYVFDLYRQGSAGGRCGLGVGLAVVKTIVELHGGTVTAFSRGPGTGSEFVIRLPAGGSAGAAGADRHHGREAPR